MNIVKKGVILGTTACLGITAYACLPHGFGSAKAIENSSNSLNSLTETAQNLSNLEMSLNNLLLATNRISYINDNLISVNSDYMTSLQKDNLGTQTTQSNSNTNSTTRNSNQTGTQTANTQNLASQTTTGYQNSRNNNYSAQPNMFYMNVNNELSRLNTNASDVRNMLSSVNMQNYSSINFDDYAKALNMAADNLNGFSTMSLSKNTNDYPVSRRLALASIRISNQALEEIKNKIGGNSAINNTASQTTTYLSNGTNNQTNDVNNMSNGNAEQSNSTTAASRTVPSVNNTTNMPSRTTTNFNK